MARRRPRRTPPPRARGFPVRVAVVCVAALALAVLAYLAERDRRIARARAIQEDIWRMRRENNETERRRRLGW